MRDLARAQTEAAIATLAAVMCKEDARDADRILAAEALLNRGWGKPTERVEQEVAVADLTPPDEQAAREAAAILRFLFPNAEQGMEIETGAPVLDGMPSTGEE